MLTLVQFVFRLSLGLAFAMALTPPRLVSAGYYRVHAYVLLGLNVLATLVAFSHPEQFDRWPPLVAAVLSYVASVAWLYEKRTVGISLLALVAIVTCIGAWLATPPPSGDSPVAWFFALADPVSGGLLLGSTMAAMLLGHWYLNTPTMQLAPLRRLILLMVAAVLLRSLLCAAGLGLELDEQGLPKIDRALFIALRWLAGLVGTAVVAIMAWLTLRVPNTQSATGILYVGVITVFLGELTSQLLSAQSGYPL